MQIDLSYSSSVPLIVPAFSHVEFIVVGAGGTGGFLISAIARLMKEIESTTNKTASCTIIDHDLVEEKNIPRQNFLFLPKFLKPLCSKVYTFVNGLYNKSLRVSKSTTLQYLLTSY